MIALRTVAFRPDPLADPPPPAREENIALFLSIAFATVLHIVIGAHLPHGRVPDVRASSMEVIEVTPPETLPLQSESESDPESDDRREEPPTTPTPAQPNRSQPGSASPARAAQVLTRSDTESGSLDLSDAIVTGNAETYAGGTTSSTGTSEKAVHGRITRGGGALAGTPSAPAITSTGPDRSRKAGLVGRLDWSCPFPSEADADGIDHGVVTLTVVIGATAKVDSVIVVRDPGHGFGAAARRCVYSRSWQPALDRGGRPIASSLPLNVRFTR